MSWGRYEMENVVAAIDRLTAAVTRGTDALENGGGMSAADLAESRRMREEAEAALTPEQRAAREEWGEALRDSLTDP